MKIILLNPYYSQTTEYYAFYRPAVPMGLLYLASYLRKHGLDSKIYELGQFDPKEAFIEGKRIKFGLILKKRLKPKATNRRKTVLLLNNLC